MNLVIHTTKEQVAVLMAIFGKLEYDEKTGEQTLTVPEWLEVMFVHSRYSGEEGGD